MDTGAPRHDMFVCFQMLMQHKNQLMLHNIELKYQEWLNIVHIADISNGSFPQDNILWI